jgi:PAS domain S-box-containing protein
MSWVTFIWAMLIGLCVAMALPNLLVGVWQRQRRGAHLFFVLAAAAVTGMAACELAMMRADSVAQMTMVMKWFQVPIFFLFVALVGFIHLYFGSRRLWLGLAAVAVRFVCLVVNFLFPSSLYFREITAIQPLQFLGETVFLPVGEVSRWTRLAELSSLLLLTFVVVASIDLWRQGKGENRRRALVVGGSIAFFLLPAVSAAITHPRIITSPHFITFPFAAMLVAMAFELGLDLFRAGEVARKLQLSEAELREEHEQMDLATTAAELGIWVWDIVANEIWISEKGRTLFGFAPSEKLDIEHFRNAIHPDDRDSMRRAVENALSTGKEYEAEHRVLLPDGQVRWLTGRGRVEFDDGKPARIRGASLDITRRKLREAALRESEARFRTVANTAPVMIWMSGLDKLCTFFNKPWLQFTGRAMEQEIGNGWAEGVHPDDLQRCLQTYAAAFDAREPFAMQYRLRRHDGEYRWISDSGVPRYDVEKNFTGYIGSCMDVTESLSNQQALRESEERMSLAMDAAKLGLWEWNVSKDELWGTKPRRALLGLPTSGKIKLEDGLSAVHADDRDRVRQTLHDAARTGEDYHLEYRVVLPDGSVQWTDHRGRCVRGAGSNELILRGISMDVTERKRAEEKFRMAVEASPSGILLVNQTGQIVLVNSQIEKLFGYVREELIGHSVEILVPERFAGAHPEHRAKFFAAPAARAMGAGRELFGRRKDGSEFPVEIGLNPIQSPEGMLILAVVVDISARKLAQTEALRHREEIGHLSRVAAMGEMAASIAHELNQPLSGIVSNAAAGQRFIDRGNVDLREFRELLADIVADGRRAGEVIRGIQSMVKKGAPVRQQVNLNDLVVKVVQMVNPNAILHSCELETLLEPNLPAIEADPIQLQQVLLNLIINALDAMRDTPVSRRKVVIATERNANDAIRTSVRDYGAGIPEETRERVFEHFFTTKATGIGMGLAIVRSIVESHGGTIACENADGGGARFHFTLPTNVAASVV